MKIVVQLPNHSHQEINLVAPLKLVYGKLLNQLHSGDGTIFYFTLDGRYDGFSHTLPEGINYSIPDPIDAPIDDDGKGH